MTLSKLMRDLGFDGAPYGCPASAQNCTNVWPVAVRFYG